MPARFIIGALSLFVCIQGAWASSFYVKTDTGVVLLWKASNNFWAAIKDSADVGISDSVYVDDKYSATLTMGKGCAVLIRGESRLCLKGDGPGFALYFDLGQIFLKRDAPPESPPIKIMARSCLITPVGTAAAVKLTKNGEPSVAVLAGKMRMESPKGESIIVEPGKFGTYNPDAGLFKQGTMPPEAIVALESWSGVKQSASDVHAKIAGNIDQSPKADSAASINVAPVNQPAASPQTPATASVSSNATGLEKSTAAGASAASAPVAVSAAPDQKTSEGSSNVNKKNSEAKQGGGNPGISWEISAGSVTVGAAQWTRLAISPDIPIWKFGVGLDIELFLDQNGDFSRKSWEFDKDNWSMSLSRKIKYLRFGHESDPLFVKVGGLSQVTLGYGFIVDRFTNMLHYPDQKLLGVQFYLNDISPLGITLQTMTPDVIEFKHSGGIAAGRLALTPFKMSGIPLVKSISAGVAYAVDLNQFTPARDWSFNGKITDKNNNGITDWDYAYQQAHSAADSTAIQLLTLRGIIDPTTTHYAKIDTMYRDSLRRYALLGGDVGVPIVKTPLLSLDVYGQAGVVADSSLFSHPTGWGFGAPGVFLTVGPLLAQIEYRHVNGQFVPGYFGPYYLDERVSRYPTPAANSDSIPKNNLDGIFGKLGINVFNLAMITGTYQYMSGSNGAMDQRLEASGQIGDAILKRIPKITRAECYFYKTGINRTVVVRDSATGLPSLQNGKPVYDGFLEMTPNLYWGYRIGIEITKGASIIWDMRYGYTLSEAFKIVPDNQMIVQTVVTF
jgi:hypothetical protein